MSNQLSIQELRFKGKRDHKGKQDRSNDEFERDNTKTRENLLESIGEEESSPKNALRRHLRRQRSPRKKNSMASEHFEI